MATQCPHCRGFGRMRGTNRICFLCGGSGFVDEKPAEATTPAIPEDVNAAAKEYADGFYPIKDYSCYESDYDYRTQVAKNEQVQEHYKAGAAHIQKQGEKSIPSSIVRRLEDINPQNSDGTDTKWYEYYATQVQGEGKESFVHSAACYLACKMAEQELFKKVKELLSAQPTQGDVQILINALKRVEEKDGYEFVTEALESYLTEVTAAQPAEQDWIELKKDCLMPDYDEYVLWYREDGLIAYEHLDKDGNQWLYDSKIPYTYWRRIKSPVNDKK